MSEVPEDYRLPETDEALLGECDVQVFRATGPGGQSVNTTDSAVRLVHRPTGIVVVCRRERSQLRNKVTCVRRLRERIAEAQRPRAPRHATKPSWGSVQRRLVSKAKTSAKKSARRKPATDD
ncbi:MAG TPA: peptide chain release factor-like protein [Coriobacteriia bacterium]